jgi:hypothetical protein
MPWGVGFVAGNGGGGDESHKLHRSSTAIGVSKTKRPKSSQLWRLLDQGRSKQEGDPSPLNLNIKLWAQTTYGRYATLAGKIAVLVHVNLHTNWPAWLPLRQQFKH